MKIITCIAPVNIAVIKYWGKRDEELILPLNDSISGTLCTDQMCAKTTVAFDASFSRDRIWLNGKEEVMDNLRLQGCIKEIKSRALEQNKILPKEMGWHIHICSENNFPTAAGLASSAAGYACLVYSLAQLFGIEGDVSSIARIGSGSACRSIDGGFVQWIAGNKPDGSDSIAKQIVDANHWPNMRVVILVVSDHKKKWSSTSGMQNSVMTSDLLKYRVAKCVPERIERITKSILDRDFDTFATITMQDSNQFHAVCLDTYPPCIYMNDISHAIADLVHQINKDSGEHIVAYTYDAGPNACLYLLEENVSKVLASVNRAFPTTRHGPEYYKGLPISQEAIPVEWESVLKREAWSADALRFIIHTKLGNGPSVVSESLLDNTGNPTH